MFHRDGQIKSLFVYFVPSYLQVERKPRPFPTLEITRKVDSIDDFKFEDFCIRDYNPHPKIHMEMAV